MQQPIEMWDKHVIITIITTYGLGKWGLEFKELHLAPPSSPDDRYMAEQDSEPHSWLFVSNWSSTTPQTPQSSAQSHTSLTSCSIVTNAHPAFFSRINKESSYVASIATLLHCFSSFLSYSQLRNAHLWKLLCCGQCPWSNPLLSSLPGFTPCSNHLWHPVADNR